MLWFVWGHDKIKEILRKSASDGLVKQALKWKVQWMTTKRIVIRRIQTTE
jgi:hypothetical protein